MDVAGPAGESSQVRYDSVLGPAPAVAAAAVAGGVRIHRPDGTWGPSVELLPADGVPLSVGTHQVAGSWSAGSPRPMPVLRLLSSASHCWELGTGTLVIHEVDHDVNGAVSRLAGSWSMPCAGATTT
ncbi:MAG TPA: hypothetical protein VNU26_01070, partial [Mycobacteriales bacterium]|nr:hypothetical protein [Mycobacteriales bacterium]